MAVVTVYSNSDLKQVNNVFTSLYAAVTYVFKK